MGSPPARPPGPGSLSSPRPNWHGRMVRRPCERSRRGGLPAGGRGRALPRRQYRPGIRRPPSPENVGLDPHRAHASPGLDRQHAEAGAGPSPARAGGLAHPRSECARDPPTPAGLARSGGSRSPNPGCGRSRENVRPAPEGVRLSVARPAHDRHWSVPAGPARGDPPASRPRHDQDPGAGAALGRQHLQRSGGDAGAAGLDGGLHDRDAGRPPLDPDGAAEAMRRAVEEWCRGLADRAGAGIC